MTDFSPVVVEVRWKDIDRSGVLNNAVYLTLFEQARFRYFDALGLMRGDDFPFVLGETCVRYLRPGRAGMRLTVTARTLRIGEKSLELSHEVLHEGAPLATGVATLVWVDEELASARVPDEARRKLAAHEDDPTLAGAPARGPLPAP